MVTVMNLNDYEEKILNWADTRGILAAGNAQAQLLKTVEELGEVAGALAKGRREDLIDGIGDVYVTLVIFSELVGVDLTSAVGAAWSEIENRKGRMENGVFIKDEADG
jgi:NTP pyrophosphatase (non-canonical NTP hydrolase)